VTALPRIGFIGLGRMGQPMAARLAGAGYPLALLDRIPGLAASTAKRLDAQAPASATALAQASDVIITILPTSADVEAVLNEGLLAGIRPGALLIEMSSGLPERSRHFARLLQAAGARFIDAPVSGGVARAVTGALSIMVGGDAQDIERARPLLAAMGTTILLTGPVGSAHAMKALNNLCSAAGLLIAAEALTIGQRAGLDPALMVDVLNVSTGMNNATQKKLKQFVLSGKFDSGFGLDLMVKDLSIALDVARHGRTPAPVAEQCRALWAAAAAALGPGRDHTEIARRVEQLAADDVEQISL
jgi:3-hydroxyisobutyrate dehydrogenase